MRGLLVYKPFFLIVWVFLIVGLVKNMVANNRTVSGVVGKFFLSLLGTMAMLVVVVLGILIANSVLQLIANIFQISNTTKLSTALFDACAGDWINGYSKAEFDVSSLTVRDIFGDYNAALFGIWPTSWKCNGMVDPNKFLYFPSLVASIALGIAMIVASVNLAKRIFEIVFLYLVMPVSMSTLAADDGARFKIWRETFITKVVLAYPSDVIAQTRMPIRSAIIFPTNSTATKPHFKTVPIPRKTLPIVIPPHTYTSSDRISSSILCRNSLCLRTSVR